MTFAEIEAVLFIVVLSGVLFLTGWISCTAWHRRKARNHIQIAQLRTISKYTGELAQCSIEPKPNVIDWEKDERWNSFV